MQAIADVIIQLAGESKDKKEFKMWYDLGMQLDNVAINTFKIYLV